MNIMWVAAEAQTAGQYAGYEKPVSVHASKAEAEAAVAAFYYGGRVIPVAVK